MSYEKDRVKDSPTVTEALAMEGISTDHHNNLPKGSRTNKDLFAKVISALREAESQSTKEARRLEAENRELRKKLDASRDRELFLENLVRAMRVKETLEAMPQLTAESKNKLIELVS